MISSTDPTIAPTPWKTYTAASLSGHPLRSVADRSLRPTSENGSKNQSTPMGSSSFRASFNANGEGWPDTSRKPAYISRGRSLKIAALILTCLLSYSTSRRTASLCDETGWSCLPVPSHRVGINIKLNRCAGCLRAFTKAHRPELDCVFGTKGFPFEEKGCHWSLPCGSRYHAECFHAGPPFVTRLKDNKGLRCPKGADPSLFPNFVCEACQVRATLQRELSRSARDCHLLCLERMRILDTMNRLAENSHRTYKYPIRRVQQFE